MTITCPCVCDSCGTAAIYAWDEAAADPIRALALSVRGHAPLNRCHKCRVGEMLPARDDQKRGAAFQADAVDALKIALAKRGMADVPFTIDVVRRYTDNPRTIAFGLTIFGKFFVEDVHEDFATRAPRGAVDVVVREFVNHAETSHPNAWAETWWPPALRAGLVDNAGNQWIVIGAEGTDNRERAEVTIVRSNFDRGSVQRIGFAHAMGDYFRPVDMRRRW